jgi:hypothetical protein
MPETEREVIYALAFSDHHLGTAELEQISRDIQAGAVFKLSKEEEDGLRPAANAYLERVGYLIIAKADAEKRAAAERRAARLDNTRMLEWTSDRAGETSPSLAAAKSEERGEQTEASTGAEPRTEMATVAASPERDCGQAPRIPSMESRVIRDRKPTLQDRAVAGLVWFLAGGFGLALVTMTPAYIVGFDDAHYHRFVYLSASIVGLIGAIYGRIPKFLKEPTSYIGK